MTTIPSSQKPTHRITTEQTRALIAEARVLDPRIKQIFSSREATQEQQIHKALTQAVLYYSQSSKTGQTNPAERIARMQQCFFESITKAKTSPTRTDRFASFLLHAFTSEISPTAEAEQSEEREIRSLSDEFCQKVFSIMAGIPLTPTEPLPATPDSPQTVASGRSSQETDPSVESAETVRIHRGPNPAETSLREFTSKNLAKRIPLMQAADELDPKVKTQYFSRNGLIQPNGQPKETARNHLLAHAIRCYTFATNQESTPEQQKQLMQQYFLESLKAPGSPTSEATGEDRELLDRVNAFCEKVFSILSRTNTDDKKGLLPPEELLMVEPIKPRQQPSTLIGNLFKKLGKLKTKERSTHPLTDPQTERINDAALAHQKPGPTKTADLQDKSGLLAASDLWDKIQKGAGVEKAREAEDTEWHAVNDDELSAADHEEYDFVSDPK